MASEGNNRDNHGTNENNFDLPRTLAQLRTASISNHDLQHLLDVASDEIERRRQNSLDATPNGGSLAPNLESLMRDSVKTFASNFMLAFNTRAGVAVLLRLFALLRKRPSSLASFQTILGENNLKYRVDAVTLGLFVGGLSGGFRLIRGLLHRFRNRDDGLNTFVAGTLASLSFFFVQHGRRRSLALYLFARAAQGMYNASKARGWFHFWGSSWPHGDTLLFVASSMWIMYAYVMRPESLPSSYWQFMVDTAPIDKTILEAVRRNNRGLPIDVEKVNGYVKRVQCSHRHVPLTPNPQILPCAVLHPLNENCNAQALYSFKRAFSSTFPLYLSLTLVPTIAFRFSHFRRAPFSLVAEATLAAIRSTTFLSTFVSSYMAMICASRRFFARDHRSWYAIAGALSSMAVLIEKKSRRSELALYAMPRAADTLFFILRERRWLVGVPFGLEILFAFSMGLLLYLHIHERDTLSPLLNFAFDVFLPKKKPRTKKPSDTIKSEEASLSDTGRDNASSS